MGDFISDVDPTWIRKLESERDAALEELRKLREFQPFAAESEAELQAKLRGVQAERDALKAQLEQLRSALRASDDLRVEYDKEAITLRARVEVLEMALRKVVVEASKLADPDEERWDQDVNKPDHWIQEALRGPAKTEEK